MPTPKHNAVLLAAGGSARLGQPKQELLIGGIPLIRHIAELLLQTSPRKLHVIVNSDAMATHLKDLKLSLIKNPDWQEGLSTSVRAIAHLLKNDPNPTLFATVDQCRLTATHLRTLLATPTKGQDVVTRYEPGAFGIPALITPATLQQADTLQADRGFGQIWRHTPQRLTFVDIPELAFDLDTPAQLATAIKRGWIDTQRHCPEKPAPTTIPTLRALKQGQLRQAIIEHAHHLFDRQGFSETTPQDIANAAGVSLRTVTRYFATPADIALTWLSTSAEHLPDILHHHLPGPSPFPTLLNILTHLVETAPEDARTCGRLITRHHALHIASLSRYQDWTPHLTSFLTRHFPKDAASAPLGTQLALTLFRTTLENWSARSPGTPFPAVLKTNTQHMKEYITQT